MCMYGKHRRAHDLSTMDCTTSQIVWCTVLWYSFFAQFAPHQNQSYSNSVYQMFFFLNKVSIQVLYDVIHTVIQYDAICGGYVY